MFSNFRKLRNFPKNASSTLPEPGIESETPFPAVTHATTRPTRQKLFDIKELFIGKAKVFVILATKIHQTLGQAAADDMTRLQILSIVPYFLVSMGSCLAISSEVKIGSRYIHSLR